MSFRDNLQHLRASRGMTQEQLAMLLGVSRQSVTKWEAERAYPEMDKLLKLCALFDCTLDELVQGDLTARPVSPAARTAATGAPQDVSGYDGHMRRRASRIATGVSVLVAGAAAGLLCEELLEPQNLATVALVGCLLLGLVVALGVCIPAGLGHQAFVKAHPFVEDFYTEDDRAAGRRTLALGVVGGLSCVFAGVLGLLLLDGRGLYGVVLLLACMVPGLWLIIYGTFMYARLDLDEYNADAADELSDRDIDAIADEARRERLRATKRTNDLVGAACSLIMMAATVLGLALLFVPAIRTEYFWLSWAFGGILCGAATIAIRALR